MNTYIRGSKNSIRMAGEMVQWLRALALDTGEAGVQSPRTKAGTAAHAWNPNWG